MLCHACQAMFDCETPSQEDMSPHHKTFATLYTAAASGCRICRKLWKVCERDPIQGTPISPLSQSEHDATEYRVFHEDPLKKDGLTIKMNALYPNGGAYGVFFKIIPTRAETGTVACDYGIDKDVLPETVWTSIHMWFRNCIKDHERCAQVSQLNQWYPSRLLKLSGLKSSKVKLIETAKTPPCGSYISLSHRWGKFPITMTTQGTLELFISGIEVMSLPKTFREAILVARNLGIGYLWIDSLCIIQGDPKDWQHEAALMHHVYRNAACNLSALDAESGHEGLFPPRNAESVRPLIVKVAWRDHPKGPYAIVDEEFWTDRVYDAPLNHRGWVFQERLLAPRVLHFGSEQVFWECQEMDACETYPEGLPTILRRTYAERFKALYQGSPVAGGQELSLADQVSDHGYYNIWHRLVTQYTKCALTMDEDKLVAISGIAKIFQSKLGDDYLAGLWRRILLDELLWQAGPRENESRGGTTRRPIEYRAPSWSWASINGVITPTGHRPDYDYDKETMAVILDARIFPLSQDPTGQVIGGMIRLRGVLYPRTLEIRNKKFRLAEMFDIRSNPIAQLVYDVRPMSRTQLPRTQLRKIYCLPLTFREDGDDFSIWGLGLEPAGVGQGVYRRFGMFNVNGKDQCKALQEETGNEEERRKLYCEEEDGVLVII